MHYSMGEDTCYAASNDCFVSLCMDGPFWSLESPRAVAVRALVMLRAIQKHTTWAISIILDWLIQPLIMSSLTNARRKRAIECFTGLKLASSYVLYFLHGTLSPNS